MSIEDFLNCEYVGLGSKLEALKTGNEWIKQQFNSMQITLDKQNELWQKLDKKLDYVTVNLKILENKILKENKEHVVSVNNVINRQNQMLLSRLPDPADDGKWDVLIEIKETIKTQNVLFETFEGKIKSLENALIKTNEENQKRDFDERISKNFQVLQNIDKKLTGIENVTATRDVQNAMNKSLQKYFNKNDTKVCFEGELNKLVCSAEFYPTSCAEFKDKFCSNTTCRIYNHQFGPNPFLVSCDNKSNGGGWTVIQRRIDGSVDFFRDWSGYKNGFGDINGEFFIGLDKLHALTATLKPVELLIQLRDFDDKLEYARYEEFEVGNELENYKLKKVGKCFGTVAFECLSMHVGYGFTTKDRDNDLMAEKNCAEACHGGWWYYNCSMSNLNGRYYKTYSTGEQLDGIQWCSREPHGFKYSLKYTQMSIRPKRL